jgi:hypothetical protein
VQPKESVAKVVADHGSFEDAVRALLKTPPLKNLGRPKAKKKTAKKC